jgi:hypothetical protein
MNRRVVFEPFDRQGGGPAERRPVNIRTRPHHHARLIGCVLAPALALVACTSHQEAGPRRPSSPAASSSAASSTAAEERLVAQAEEALEGTVGEDDGFVESGAERVTDGVHSQPSVVKGKTYRLTVVCVGSGTAEITFTPAAGTARRTVPCDRSPVFERFSGTPPLRLDITGTPGSSGMIAWRVSTL